MWQHRQILDTSTVIGKANLDFLGHMFYDTSELKLNTARSAGFPWLQLVVGAEVSTSGRNQKLASRCGPIRRLLHLLLISPDTCPALSGPSIRSETAERMPALVQELSLSTYCVLSPGDKARNTQARFLPRWSGPIEMDTGTCKGLACMVPCMEQPV